jgi:hypothetical protein
MWCHSAEIYAIGFLLVLQTHRFSNPRCSRVIIDFPCSEIRSEVEMVFMWRHLQE